MCEEGASSTTKLIDLLWPELLEIDANASNYLLVLKLFPCARDQISSGMFTMSQVFTRILSNVSRSSEHLLSVGRKQPFNLVQHQPLFHSSRRFARNIPDDVDITRPRVIQRKPTTPSQRHTALIDRSGLYRGRPKTHLTFGMTLRAGRSRSTGRITVRHRGGGHKRKYRIIDFKRSYWSGIPAVVERIEYDPNRTAFIALLKHKEKCPDIPKKCRPDYYAYIICPAGLRLNSEVIASRTESVDVKVGNAMLLRYIPVGTKVHNVELYPGHGGQMCRSAGTSAQVLERDEAKGLALLRLQSKEKRLVRLNCMASIGEVSNPEHQNQSYGKAGRMRWKGRRPRVRGVAMNPVDHPHGGGEGKTSGGRPSVSKWSKPTKGYRTRSKRKINPLIVQRRAP